MNVDRWKTEITLNMKTTLRSILLLGLTGTAFQASAEQPNLIFILADDQGYGDVSYAGGLAPTPHIDRLAKEGIHFTDAHTTSWCTPTRYSILTGRYNWRSR